MMQRANELQSKKIEEISMAEDEAEQIAAQKEATIKFVDKIVAGVAFAAGFLVCKVALKSFS